MTPYAKRKIDVTFNYGRGQYGEERGEDVTLSGLRVSASIVALTGAIQAEAHVRIFGMPLAMINQLTGTGPGALEIRSNSLMITAGDEGGAMSTAYRGNILRAFGSFRNAPEVAFEVLGLGAGFDAIKPVAPRSYKGTVDAADVMADLAKQMGLAFENNGVSVMLSNAYFSGTAWEQVKACGEAAQIYYTVSLGKLAIWPRTGYRAGAPIKVSPATGMVGYPDFSSQGLVLTTLYNPDMELGRQVDVTSDITVACGVWNVYSVVHTLESETPNGQWFTQVNCYRWTE